MRLFVLVLFELIAVWLLPSFDDVLTDTLLAALAFAVFFGLVELLLFKKPFFIPNVAFANTK